MKPFVLSVRKPVIDGDKMREGDRAMERVLLRELDRWIEGANRPRVVLDCSELDAIGLSDIRFFMSCLERVMKRNGDARIAGLSPRARQILSRSGVDRLFRIYDSRESAVRSFDTHPNFETVGDGGFAALHETPEER